MRNQLSIDEDKDLPTVNIDTKIEDIFTVISRGKIGLCVVVDEYFNVLGVITDGDVRRKMITKRSIFFDLQAKDIINKNPISTNKDVLLSNLENVFLEKNINTIVVKEQNKLLGIITYKSINN